MSDPAGGPAGPRPEGFPLGPALVGFLLRDFEKIVCAVLLLAMTLLGFGNVAVRYLTNYSFAASEELLTAGFVVVTVFGGAIAARRGEHLAVEFVADCLPTGLRRAVFMLAAALSTLLLALSAWYSLRLVMNQLGNGMRSYALQLPLWTYSCVLPFAFLLLMVRYLQYAREHLRSDPRLRSDGGQR